MTCRSEQGLTNEKVDHVKCLRAQVAFGHASIALSSNTVSDIATELEQLRGNLSLAEEGLASATQEIERLRGIKPELPPRPPDEGDQALPRYGIRWNDKGEPLSVPMVDGYWTPWHLADRLTPEPNAAPPHCPTCLCGIGHCPKHPAAIFHPPAACPECASGNAAYSIEGMMAAEKSSAYRTTGFTSKGGLLCFPCDYCGWGVAQHEAGTLACPSKQYAERT